MALMVQALSLPPMAPSRSVNANRQNVVPLTNSVSFPASQPRKVKGLTIRCARVGGVEIPNGKRVEFSLQYIHGVGRALARTILHDVGFENKVTKELSEEELIILRKEVNKHLVEGDLRRFTALSIKRLKEIRCYRGIRHIKGLPCRGQHTKNNCRTLKGKKVTMPGKKKTPR